MKIRCTNCNTIIEGSMTGDSIKCECGACMIDEDLYRIRLVGRAKFMNIINEDGTEEPVIKDNIDANYVEINIDKEENKEVKCQTNLDYIRDMDAETLARFIIAEAPSIGMRYTDSIRGLETWLNKPCIDEGIEKNIIVEDIDNE